MIEQQLQSQKLQENSYNYKIMIHKTYLSILSKMTKKEINFQGKLMGITKTSLIKKDQLIKQILSQSQQKINERINHWQKNKQKNSQMLPQQIIKDIHKEDSNPNQKWKHVQGTLLKSQKQTELIFQSKNWVFQPLVHHLKLNQTILTHQKNILFTSNKNISELKTLFAGKKSTQISKLFKIQIMKNQHKFKGTYRILNFKANNLNISSLIDYLMMIKQVGFYQEFGQSTNIINIIKNQQDVKVLENKLLFIIENIKSMKTQEVINLIDTLSENSCTILINYCILFHRMFNTPQFQQSIEQLFVKLCKKTEKIFSIILQQQKLFYESQSQSLHRKLTVVKYYEKFMQDIGRQLETDTKLSQKLNEMIRKIGYVLLQDIQSDLNAGILEKTIQVYMFREIPDFIILRLVQLVVQKQSYRKYSMQIIELLSYRDQIEILDKQMLKQLLNVGMNNLRQYTFCLLVSLKYKLQNYNSLLQDIQKQYLKNYSIQQIEQILHDPMKLKQILTGIS